MIAPDVAVVLAAGTGSRLLPLTADRPKCLVTIGDEPMIVRAARMLAARGVKKLVAVTGYRAEMVHAALAHAPLAVTFAHNEAYATTQNVLSLAIGLRAISHGGSFSKLDGDVVFDDEVLARSFACETSHALVDRSPGLALEEMKVKLAGDGSDRIVAFGKHLVPSECAGESIGIETFRGGDVATIRSAIEHAVSIGRTGVYYEDVYDTVVDTLAMRAVFVRRESWGEIDDAHDLAVARDRFAPPAR